MTTDAHAGVLAPAALLGELVAAGARLEAGATAAGLATLVPSCPGWDVRELLRHTGGVHRWATAQVATAAPRQIPGSDDLESFVGGWPADADLLGWFAAGHRGLVAALEAAPEQLDCFTFLPAPSAKWFWTRRQAHETAVHAVDAMLAAGQPLSIAGEFAADGLDELLRGFVPRMRRRLAFEAPARLVVDATDVGARFVVEFAAEGPRAARVAAVPQAREDGRTAVVAGPAHLLYLWSWSRAGREGLTLSGALEIVDHFEQRAHVTWS